MIDAIKDTLVKAKKTVTKKVEKRSFKIKGSQEQKDQLHQLNKIEIADNVIFKGENSLAVSLGKDNSISIRDGVCLNNVDITIKGNNNVLIIEENVRWTGRIIIVGANRTIKIGARTTAQGCYILSRDVDVSVGEDCMFSREIEIRATDVHKIYDAKTKQRINFPKSNVVIGNKVWIGARVMVSKNSIIPDGCIVGACSFVSKAFDVKNCIIAGSPAKMIKEDIYWER